MKKVILLLIAVLFSPAKVGAWNTPGENFCGELKFSGNVTNTRNPWSWKLGDGHKNLEVRQQRNGAGKNQLVPAVLPRTPILLGKTTFPIPAGREGLSPHVSYGNGLDGFSLVWIKSGLAEVTLPLIGDDNNSIGKFVFKMEAAAIFRYVDKMKYKYLNVYDDMNSNGLPTQAQLLASTNVPGTLQVMFNGDAPDWLRNMTISGTVGLSRFRDRGLHQIEGVYGAQIVPGSGELHINSTSIPEHWHVSLPINIEYK